MSEYKKHYRSKYEFPTRIVSNGKEGTLVIGYKTAWRDIETKLGRPLHKDTKINTAGGNWKFMEPVSTTKEVSNGT